MHTFFKSNPKIDLTKLINSLKGVSSRLLFKEFPELKSKLPTLWTRSYYCESVGHISEDTIKKYIEDQKGK